ncbi:winged helix-turn-helix domain-containing protein [Actinomadura madurae]|uniref:winged helix-turn-helix domain-containing protein n=1 Tax=Actinomadura madurae TaxID=1993 RepID=UPI0026E50D39|nr:winged helix-turn-helix domain-containing protein [Actinomadura madurae]
MAIEWAGSPPELLLPLDRDAAGTLRSQLEGGLRDAICGGRLKAGERLPSSRELSRQLGVSRGLVQECYGQLTAEGYLCTRAGSATRVAPVRAHRGTGPSEGRRPRRGSASTSPPASPTWRPSRAATGAGRSGR